ncbi:MAG: histidine kinase [Bacteroidia bacterium]|nr:histidine kinase [Bacteroidia bacterium]
MFKRAIILFYLVAVSWSIATAQSISADTVSLINNNSSINNSALQLQNSLSSNQNSSEISAGYFDLAMELIKTGDFAKAEVYMIKAVQIESGKKKKSNRISEYYRELAKIQEILKKNDVASDNFLKASEYTTDKTQKQINQNDAYRLKGNTNTKVKLQYLQQNSVLLNNSNNSSEKVQNLTQMANANLALNNSDQALENYNSALNIVDSNSEKSMLIKSDIANLYAETNNFDKAITVQKEVVEQSLNIANVETQLQQMQKLSSLYFAKNSVDEGLKVLLDAYKLSLDKGNIKAAKSSLEMLANYYEKNKDNLNIVKLYKNFIGNLETLISKDSSLVDKQIFNINEKKISQLEKEKTLKDELIVRKNNYNYVLVGSVLILLFLLAIIIKAWISIKKRNIRIALQSLRREMNPHFIFNSLNSVNQFIAENNELEANKYLTSYSNLMRNMMENSNKDYVTLSLEIEQLTKYLELEKLRFADKFEYIIEVDENIDKDTVQIPNMIIQPNLENAIWHGLRYKESKGLLKLKFTKEGNKTVVFIDDNGIGLQESKNIKTKNQKLHESRGLKNVHERIYLLNKLYNNNIRFEVTEKSEVESGVIVRIEF